MSILECKNCGAPLPEVSKDGTVTCRYCGLAQSVPMTDLKTANLYKKANNERRFQQYDEAMETYRSILKLNPDAAEAYWGLCLSRYGVEFVTDPPTGRVMATMNRMHRELITADTDYQQALAHAGLFVRDHYQEVADYLASVQQNYFLLKEKEKPYDIFICFKDSNEDGSRTRDSIHAEVLYDELTAEGYRVFFSRRTLKEVSGQQYEGHIYMALSNAKVMLLLSSKPEYVETPWMKNEWSRYLYQISQNPSKKLILLYRDLDPAALPAKLSKLQGLDMKRWDFLKTLKERLKAIFEVKEEPVKAEAENDEEYLSLLSQAEKAMAGKDYKKAAEGFEELLNYTPKSSKTYFKLYLAKGNGKYRLDLEEGAPTELILAFRFADENEKKEYLDAMGPVIAEACYKEWKRCLNEDSDKEKTEQYLKWALALATEKKKALWQEESRELQKGWEKRLSERRRKKEAEEQRLKKEQEKQRLTIKRARELSDAGRRITEAHNSRIRTLKEAYEAQNGALLRDTISKDGKKWLDGYFYAFPVLRSLLMAVVLLAYGITRTLVLPRIEEMGNDAVYLAALLGAPVIVFLAWFLWISGSYLCFRLMKAKDLVSASFLVVIFVFLPSVILVITGGMAFLGLGSEKLVTIGLKAYVLLHLYLILIDWFMQVARCGEMKERLYSFDNTVKQIKKALADSEKAWEENSRRIMGQYPTLEGTGASNSLELDFQGEIFEKLPGIFSGPRKYAARLKIKELIGLFCCIAVIAGMWIIK